MRLYILRHGQAGPSQPGESDDARTLTNEGREEMRRIARRLAALGIDVDVILTSPLPRAKETAEIAAEALGKRDAVVVDEALQPGCMPGAFQAA
jgi:phosphohistidine phosphatase